MQRLLSAVWSWVVKSFAIEPEDCEKMELDPQSTVSPYVIKRDGRREEILPEKITSRVKKLCYGLNMNYINPAQITEKAASGIYKGVTTVELDNFAAEVAASMTTMHPDYALLAARIAISNLHKETNKVFSEVIHTLYTYVDPEDGCASPMVSEDVYRIVQANKDILNSTIIYDRDFAYTYFGFKTLERSYLLKINGKVVERPQQMLMRVAVGIHKQDIQATIQTYNLMSERWFTHASPTLFNAGTCFPQLSSCFLLPPIEDSMEGICKELTDCALISKSAGGIGLSVHSVRAFGSRIKTTKGISNGIVPMLRVYNNMSRYVDQGGNKRPGAYAVYLEPWHADILEFLELRLNSGCEELRARDLFYALWIPDLFMERVKSDGQWSLMCPKKCPGLQLCWGEEFNKLYAKYENEGRFNRQLPAREVWKRIITAQTETGTPYMLYKDACNRKSNQQNLGTITCSNLCTEIIEFTSKEEIAVCNLASIALPRFVRDCEDGQKGFDFVKLKEVTKVVTRNLNKIIDVNRYPVPEAERSNKRHRPIGIGVQGLADAFLLMRLPFVSEQAKLLNRQIFETIYYGALEASCELAMVEGTYETYLGSPVSRGELQYDMWKKENPKVAPTDLWDWAALKAKIALHGVRNSLLLAPMPTASTAQILGNNESIEPYTTNIYSRRVLSGDFQVVNPHLMKDMIELNLWDDQMKQRLISEGGSVQNIRELPDHIRELYKTVWEIPQKELMNMAADRAAFIDQSQSLNLFIAEPTYSKLTSMHFYGWQLGLKTGMYYLRTRPAVDAVKFTVNKQALREAETNKLAKEEEMVNGDGKQHLLRPALGQLSNKLNQQTPEPPECLMCSG